MSQTEFRIVIPARYGSSRFPGKPLVPIAGQAMISHTWACAVDTGATDIVIATDDERIVEHCESRGHRVLLTSAEHPTGTDRVAEVVDQLDWPEDAIVVCLQGDEPATPPAIIHQVARNLAAHPEASIATLCASIESIDDFQNPNRVKVVFDTKGFALYFSRAPIPYRRDHSTPAVASSAENRFPEAWVHVGMYAYRAGFLKRFQTMAPHPYEQEEKLEQLRALANGYRIHVEAADSVPAHGVDHPDDVAVLEALLASGSGE